MTPLTITDIDARVRDFLAQELIDFPIDVAQDAPLDDYDFDSLNVTNLLAFLEAEFGFAMPDEDITPTNLESIRSLVGYLAERLSVQALAS